METVPICQICKEPIWNFFCPDCLAKDVKAWLPSEYSKDFKSFHGSFSGHFHSSMDSTFTSCLKCKAEKESALCPYCYVNEVIHWMKAENVNMANSFVRLFPFDFDRVGHNVVLKTRSVPIDTEQERRHAGLCDVCGEYGDSLLHTEGQWVCEKCRD
jgi:hypothetical protein